MLLVSRACSSPACGCADCHASLDVGVLPHGNSGKFAKGLSAEGAQSCLACHQKPAYAKLRHGSLGAACNACHSVHSPQHAKLLNEDTAAICYACHDRRGYAARLTHKPVAKGDCDGCHEMHATEHASLLSGGPGEDCLTCHARVKKGQHAAASSLSDGHPVGGEKAAISDPARPGRPFQCVSCHDPHKSNARGLIRFDPPGRLCEKCHSL